MKRRFCVLFLLVVLLINTFAIPSAATDVESPDGTAPEFTYATGTFYPSETTHTVEHNLGYVPDVMILWTSQTPVAGTMFFSVGYSGAMLSALGEDAYSFVVMVTAAGSLAPQTKEGFEGTSLTNGDNYGFIRAVNTETFTVGGSFAALQNTGYVKDGVECGAYSWLAIGGLSEYMSTRDLTYTRGSIYPSETSITAQHNAGVIPDIMILWTTQTPAAGTMFFSVGYSGAMLSALGEDAYGFTDMVTAAGTLAPRTKEGFEGTSLTNGDSYGFIRAVNTETFTVGGSFAALQNTGYVKDGVECGAYSWLAISGISADSAESDHTHDYSASVTAPTCEAGGYTTHTCSICGKSYSDTVTAALGHTWSDSILIEPTCTEEGRETMTCTTCGEEQVETLPAVGHDFQNGICAICGAVDPDAPGSGGADPDISNSDSGSGSVNPEPPESSSVSSVDPNPSESGNSSSVAPDPSESSGGGGSVESKPSESDASPQESDFNPSVSDNPDASETAPVTSGGMLVPGGVHSAPVKPKERSDVAPGVMLMGAVCAFIVIYSALEPSNSGSRRRRRR